MQITPYIHMGRKPCLRKPCTHALHPPLANHVAEFAFRQRDPPKAGAGQSNEKDSPMKNWPLYLISMPVLKAFHHLFYL